MIAQPGPTPEPKYPKYEHGPCSHFIDDGEILADLMCCSFSPLALTRSSCWKEICKVRGFNQNPVDPEFWRELWRVRAYLLARQNPRGF